MSRTTPSLPIFADAEPNLAVKMIAVIPAMIPDIRYDKKITSFTLILDDDEAFELWIDVTDIE